MKKKLFLLIIVLLSTYIVNSQNNIDYNNKILIKELHKEDISIDNLIGIEDMNSYNTLDKYKFYKLNAKNQDVEYLLIGRVNCCRTGGCTPENTLSLTEEYEYFDYIIFFDSKANVKKVRIFNYQASHGEEVTANSWLDQFIGYSSYLKTNNMRKIDAVSGATVTVDAIKFDIELKTQMLADYIFGNFEKNSF